MVWISKSKGLKTSAPLFYGRKGTITFAASLLLVVFLLCQSTNNNYSSSSLTHLFDTTKSSFEIQDWYRDLLNQRFVTRPCLHTYTFFHYFLPHFNCRRKERFGKCDDGAKWICLDLFEGRNSKRASAISEKCVVYSFGSSDDACFEEALVSKFDCEIHIFDPTSSTLQNPKWTYHSYGLGGEDPAITDYWDWRTQKQANCTSCPMKHLPDIMKELGHDYIDILKVDIDGAEWRSFNYIYKHFKTLPADQLQIELTGLDVTPVVKDSLAGGYPGNIKWWENILTDGFKVFELEPNYGTCGYRTKQRGASVEYALWRGE